MAASRHMTMKTRVAVVNTVLGWIEKGAKFDNRGLMYDQIRKSVEGCAHVGDSGLKKFLAKAEVDTSVLSRRPSTNAGWKDAAARIAALEARIAALEELATRPS